jgi:hypothetical protein
MSLIDNLKGGGTKPPQFNSPQAPAIAEKLRAAEAELAELERQHSDAALDSVLGTTGGADRLATLNRQLAAARDKAATFRSAHAAAVARDEAAARAYRASLQKTQINAVRQHLAARDKAAERLSAAIADAATAYHELLDRSGKAQAAWPVGMGDCPAEAALTSRDVLRSLVGYELHRVSAAAGDLGGEGRALLGSRLPSMNFQHQPEAIPPLVDRVRRASAHTIRELTGDKEPV